jgi:hypothetical protein
VAAAGLDVPVHLHIALLDEHLGVPTRGGRAGELEERAQRERGTDENIDQLLNLIGMMR